MPDLPRPPVSCHIFANLELTPSARRLLEQGTAGHELVLASSPASSMDRHTVADPRIHDADILFGQPDPAAIAHAPRVRWIQISSAGYTRYDTTAFRVQMAERHIAVCNSAQVFAEACALHVLSFILAQSRQLPLALRSRYAHGEPDWHVLRNASIPLENQTVLILGFGAIGQRVAQVLAPMNMHIMAHRRHRQGNESVPFISAADLPAALARADHIVNILPENPQTHHFFDAARFSQAKPGAIFYNIGRGATVDQAALLAALNSGRIAGAWLDVTEPEPLPPGHPLLAHPRCFMTPHTAGGHADEVGHLVRHFLENFQRFLAGQPLSDRIM